VANVLRVLPDVQQPVAPEMLVDLDDNSQAASIVSLPVPATPPFLGLLGLVDPPQGDDLLRTQAL
jgi:hypothetical protein